MHGARSGGRLGERNGNYRHGANTKEMKAALAEGKRLVWLSRKALTEIFCG